MTFISRLCAAVLAAAALAFASPALAKTHQAYLGTYTPDPADPTVVGNRGEGVYLADVDDATGAISNVRLAVKTLSPSWLILSADHKFLYAVNEIGTYGPNKSGSVTAYAINADGGLTQINVADSGGSIPCHINIDPSGKFAFVANYIGGTFAVLRINADGSLGEMTDLIKPGPGARGHMTAFDPSGQYVVGDDAGLNQIFVWKLDGATGKLTEISRVKLGARKSPRHFVFSPDGKTLYQIMEATSELFVFNFEAGTLTQRGAPLSALPDGFAGNSYSSELLISKTGGFLYSANRLHDSVTVFKVARDGGVRRVANVHTEGDYPRSLTLDSAGRFLYSMNQRANNITSYRVGPDGGLKFTGKFLSLGTPAAMVFLN